MRSCPSVLLRGTGFLLAVLSTSAVIMPRDACAHPMGNFSISHYAGIRVDKDWIEIRYILEMAEIPTFQELQQAGITAQPADPGVVAYLARKAEVLKSGLAVTLDSQPAALETVSENVIFPPGAGGLPTMKVGVLYRALLTGAAHPGELCTLNYRDNNYPERAGWKEVVVAAAPGLTLHSSTAATVSRSRELSDYPTDLINSPPQDLAAQLTFILPAASELGSAHGGPAAKPTVGANPASNANQHLVAEEGRGFNPAERQHVDSILFHALDRSSKRTVQRAGVHESHYPLATAGLNPRPSDTPSAVPALARSQSLALHANKQGTPSNRFTQLITSNQWGLWFLLTAALIAAALGGLHALEPGHGKTIVAAYLVGSQGTAAHALMLGLIVTATHTAGVYALGLLTLYASKYVVPDHLYPWLGIGSGLTIVILGAYMLQRRLMGREHGHHHHDLAEGHDHSHEYHHHHHQVHLAHVHGSDHQKDTHTHGSHAHGYAHAHGHGHHHHQHLRGGSFSYRRLALLGVTGGIIPCPAALVVLLSAVSLHRVAFGLYLILAFSLGLAAVLISIGLITVYARRLLARVPSEGLVINRWLPMASAAVITCLGVAITIQGLSAMGVLHVRS